MEEWTQMFSSNPDFGIMEQAYMKLKTTSEDPVLHYQYWVRLMISRPQFAATLETRQA